MRRRSGGKNKRGRCIRRAFTLSVQHGCDAYPCNHERFTSHANLLLTGIECIKVQDATGKDDVEVWRTDLSPDRRLAGVLSMGRNDVQSMSSNEPFTTTITIRVIDIDKPGGDDVLGEVTIDAKMKGTGPQTAHLRQQPHADYHLYYEVV